jgi:hypothetical protein
VDHGRAELPGNRTQRKARRTLEAWNYWKKDRSRLVYFYFYFFFVGECTQVNMTLVMLEGSPGFSPHVLFNTVAMYFLGVCISRNRQLNFIYS